MKNLAPVKTLTVDGFTVHIYTDLDAQNPEEVTDAPIYLVHFHRQFEHCSKDLPFTRATFGTWAADLAKESTPRSWGVWSLASYIHGDVTLALLDSSRASNFPDQQWDVSRCGWILIPRQEWVEYTGVTAEEVNWRKLAEAHVEEWNQYLSGDVYGYEVEGTNDSCWGFYGMKAVEEAATEAAQGCAAVRAREAAAFTHLSTLAAELVDLDELVHEQKAAEASDINNSGPEAQMRYLMETGSTAKWILHSAERRMFDLSTAHMPSSSPEWGTVRAVPHETGWVVFVPGGDAVPSAEQLEGEPEWLRPLLKEAREHPAMLINFDQDAPVCDDLPTWEW